MQRVPSSMKSNFQNISTGTVTPDDKLARESVKHKRGCGGRRYEGPPVCHDMLESNHVSVCGGFTLFVCSSQSQNMTLWRALVIHHPYTSALCMLLEW